MAKPGETLAADSYRVFPGGKGLNQSIALAKAGIPVVHVGKVGQEGLWLKAYLTERGVDTALVQCTAQATGHAVIQVSRTGENAIIIHGGANRDLDPNLVVEAFSDVSAGDFLLVQNETNAIADIINAGHALGLTLVMNPAPMNEQVLTYPLEKLHWFIVNETEGAALTGKKGVDDILKDLRHRFPNAGIVLTLGEKGVLFSDSSRVVTFPAYKIEAVDTTGTGDTFIGFFLAALVQGKKSETALKEASAAAAICATRQGAASSIPGIEEVQRFMQKV